MLLRPVGPTCQKLNPLKLKAISARMRVANCRRPFLRNTGWAGPTLPRPLCPPLSRDPFTGSTCLTRGQGLHSLRHLWFSGGGPSLFSQGSPLWMHNFIFGSVNPSLPCDQHSTPGKPAPHAHLPGSSNGAKDRSASATDSSDYDQTHNSLFSESSLCISFKEQMVLAGTTFFS